MRALLVVTAALVAAHPTDALAQDWSLVTYDLSDIEDAARDVRLRDIVSRASRLDTEALGTRRAPACFARWTEPRAQCTCAATRSPGPAARTTTG